MTCTRCSLTSPATNAYCIKGGDVFCLTCVAILRYEAEQQPKRPVGRPPIYTPELVQSLLTQLGSKIHPDEGFFLAPIKEQIVILQKKLQENTVESKLAAPTSDQIAKVFAGRKARHNASQSRQEPKCGAQTPPTENSSQIA